MNKILLILLSLPCLAQAEGPLFTQKDPISQQEFENVYQDIRTKFSGSSITFTTDITCIDSPTLCVDKVTHRVGVGTVSPGNVLGVNGGIFASSSTSGASVSIEARNTSNTTGSDASLRVTSGGTSAGDPFVRYTIIGGGDWVSGLDNSNNDSFVISNNSNPGTNDYIIITSAGEVTQPLQPSFLAQQGSATNITGDGTVYTLTFTTEIFDQSNDFASGTFTAPITGRYALSAMVGISGWTITHEYCRVKISTSNRDYAVQFSDIGKLIAGSGQSFPVSVIADMDANDTATVTLEVDASTLTVDLTANAQFNFFSGSLIN